MVRAGKRRPAVGARAVGLTYAAKGRCSLRADLEPADTLHSRLYGPDPHPAQLEGRGDWSPEAAAKEDRQAKSGFDSRRSCAMPGCDSSQVPNDSGWTVHSPTIGQYGR